MRGRLNIATILGAALTVLAVLIFAQANYSVAVETSAVTALAADVASGEEVQQPTPAAVNEPAADPAPVAVAEIVVAKPAPAEPGPASVTPRTIGPLRLVIPSINLNSAVVHLGVNAKGEMDVPSGETNDVGWYKYGTMPGNVGSAVIDAHVFAAFANLNKVSVGEELYVVMGDGSNKRFRVYEARTYALADVPLQRLFNGSGGRYLNLITCAGQLTADRSTYDHRLIVYAELVQD